MSKNMDNSSNQCVLVSKCLKKQQGYYLYRYYGAYKGIYINKVKIQTAMRMSIGESYVLFLNVQSVEDTTLYGKVTQASKIEDFSWI